LTRDIANELSTPQNLTDDDFEDIPLTSSQSNQCSAEADGEYDYPYLAVTPINMEDDSGMVSPIDSLIVNRDPASPLGDAPISTITASFLNNDSIWSDVDKLLEGRRFHNPEFSFSQSSGTCSQLFEGSRSFASTNTSYTTPAITPLERSFVLEDKPTEENFFGSAPVELDELEYTGCRSEVIHDLSTPPPTPVEGPEYAFDKGHAEDLFNIMFDEAVRCILPDSLLARLDAEYMDEAEEELIPIPAWELEYYETAFTWKGAKEIDAGFTDKNLPYLSASSEVYPYPTD
jgi:hypothetical protein